MRESLFSLNDVQLELIGQCALIWGTGLSVAAADRAAAVRTARGADAGRRGPHTRGRSRLARHRRAMRRVTAGPVVVAPAAAGRRRWRFGTRER